MSGLIKKSIPAHKFEPSTGQCIGGPHDFCEKCGFCLVATCQYFAVVHADVTPKETTTFENILLGNSSTPIRTFESGATRDQDATKHDYEGFLSPLVVQRFGEYMHKHRQQADGKMRDSDNWQKGIPKTAYMKSMWRHFLDVWLVHRGYVTHASLEDALCALLFNVCGYLHEVLKARLDA